jgi:hypothetical protein
MHVDDVGWDDSSEKNEPNGLAERLMKDSKRHFPTP